MKTTRGDWLTCALIVGAGLGVAISGHCYLESLRLSGEARVRYTREMMDLQTKAARLIHGDPNFDAKGRPRRLPAPPMPDAD